MRLPDENDLAVGGGGGRRPGDWSGLWVSRWAENFWRKICSLRLPRPKGPWSNSLSHRLIWKQYRAERLRKLKPIPTFELDNCDGAGRVNDGSHFVTDGLDRACEPGQVDRYLIVFQRIFEKLHHGGHYKMMMGDYNVALPVANEEGVLLFVQRFE